MCDFSLQGSSCIAQANDYLVLVRIHPHVAGLVAMSDLIAHSVQIDRPKWRWRKKNYTRPEDIAGTEQCPFRCIPPGSRLKLENVPQAAQKKFRIGATTPAIFMQDLEIKNGPRDGVLFWTRRTALLNELFCDTSRLRVTVLSVSGDHNPENIEEYCDYVPEEAVQEAP